MTVPLLPYQNPYVDYLGPVVQPNSKLIGLQWITELRACSPDHGGEFMIGKVIWALMTAIIMATPFLLIFLLIRTLRIGKVFEWGYVIVIGLTLIYNVYDNNRFILKEESVYIENLPLAFEGLTILQISDLHGKSFGRNQTNLTSQINRLDYDVIAFTGDMETTVRSFEPFYELLDGIDNKTHMLYANGNVDLAYKFSTGEITATGRKLEEHGCTLLNRPYPLVRDGATLWLIDDTARHFDFELPDELSSYHGDKEREVYTEYVAALTEVSAQNKKGEANTVVITHIPFSPKELEAATSQSPIFNYDLIIAGHYHGGQIRIPLYGAIYVPVSNDRESGWFPEQKYVSGLVEYDGIQQYVSRGLGTSRMFPLRLFNTPEINLITLRSKI